MQLGLEKQGPKSGTPNSTPNREAQNDQDMTARMHFYAVRSTGDQLRWGIAPLTSKKSDRMAGR